MIFEISCLISYAFTTNTPMSEKLKLEISEENTLVTSLQEPSKFIEYEINARQSMDHTHARSGILWDL